MLSNICTQFFWTNLELFRQEISLGNITSKKVNHTKKFIDRAVRGKWLKFVQRHRVDFKELISKHAFLCSVHFERSCYENSLAFTL